MKERKEEGRETLSREAERKRGKKVERGKERQRYTHTLQGGFIYNLFTWSIRA